MHTILLKDHRWNPRNTRDIFDNRYTEVRCDHQFEYKFTLKIILQLYSIETPLVKWIGGKFDLQDIDLVTYF